MEIKERLKPNEVVAPTLFVGVGGTGCKIVKKVADLCHEKEKENINFLCLDTNVNDLSDVANGKSKIHWVQTSNTQTVGSYLDYDEEARKKWFPKNAVMYDKTVSEGAGQVRAISRLALNSTIKTGKIRPLYDSIDELFRKTGKDMKQAMRVVIASTASGGTGSGIILPLSMFIRDYVKEKYPNTSLIVRALVLLPETLDSVIDSQTERDSQARNAYATIKELNAFMMKGSGFIDLDEDLKQFSGMHVNVSIAGSDKQKPLALLPMDFCFLMDGQDAEDSTMISISQYIEQAAQALYEQNIGPMQKKAFSVEDNIIKEMTKPGNYGRNRFGGIGAGVLRYPYQKIAQYVAYDLAIDSIGGEGDATKWTKYDNQVRAYQAEQKKRGVPMSTWEPKSKKYCDYLLAAKDNFSKDLNNTYELENLDERIETFQQEFEAMALQTVMNDTRFGPAHNNAMKWKGQVDYNDGEHKIMDAVNQLKPFASMVEAKSKDGSPIIEGIVSNWVEALMTADQPTTQIKDTYSIESLLRNAQDEIMHPCAARYVLYRLMEKFEEKKVSDDHINAGKALQKAKEKSYEFKFSKGEVNGINGLGSLEVDTPKLMDKLKGYKQLGETASTEIPNYIKKLEDYCKKVAVHAAYSKAYDYVKAFAEQFEQFFGTFVYKVKDLSRKKVDLVDSLAYKKGDSIVNICSDEALLKELSQFSLQKAQKETTMLNSDINGGIFDAVKRNAIFKMELDNTGGSCIEEDRRVDIFDKILMGYFEKSVREKCDDIDKDIINAIAQEQRMKERIRIQSESSEEGPVIAQVSTEDAKRHILETIKRGERIAAPSVQRATNEEPREIKVCAYNKALLDDRKFRVKDLMPNGEAVETVSKYEIHFYNALYNLTPNKLKKFAAPFETETGKKSAGTYHKAYSEYSQLIGPDSTKNAAISTHIDKSWDSIKSMPELDFDYQTQVIRKIHKAFIYGLIHNAIQQRPLSAVANGKKVFMYRDSTNRDVELVVPNGTLCDEFYEILDALYVNSKVVEDITLIKNRKRAMSEAKNCDYENTEFFRDMARFNLLHILHDMDDAKKYDSYDGTQKDLDALKDKLRANKAERTKRQNEKKEWSVAEIEDDGAKYVENATSLFAIPLIFYCTLPNSGRYVSEITAMVEAVIDVFREEYSKWEKAEDVKFVLCNRLTDELNLLRRNYKFYEKYLRAPAASENLVIDIIQRKIRDVILSAPEPEDYEALLDKVAKEFKDSENG